MFANLFYQRFINHFAKEDNWHNLDISTGNLGYGWFHYAIIRNLRPTKILCIGSRYGYIPAVCALACRDNRYGQVDFVDAGYDLSDQKDKDRHWGGVGFWKTKQGQKQFHKFGLDHYIKLHIMTTQKFFKKYSRRHWQYVYIDGDHSYKGVKFDWKQSWLRMNKGDFLTLHDIFTTDLGELEYGVNTFWNEIQSSHGGFAIPGRCGLGIMQK